jgi:hypothetical protein
MMNFTYCPILGLSYFYTQPILIKSYKKPSVKDLVQKKSYKTIKTLLGGITSNF